MKILRLILNYFSVCLFCLTVYLLLGYKDSVAVREKAPVVTSFTVSPEVPRSVHFCGKEIDLTRYNMREGLDRELSGFTYLHSSTLLLIKRANRYFPIIEPILAANGVPDDFKYLAVIESQLDPKATSSARAAGMWQFMESTGKQFGLRVTGSVDERRHVEKSTQAACRYLKEAYEIFGDWLMVAASYNAGMERISSRIKQQQETSVFDLYLVDETTRYTYRLLAVKLIFENPYKYGFVLKADNLYSPIRCREAPVEEDITDLVDFARQYGITYRDLKDFNPWLKDTKLVTGGGNYVLLIPYKDDLYYNAPNRYVHNRRWVSD